ncbi:hypothetical protein N658DRAFT_501069 [Parathielavia hyrcaniae]|uniref:Uncharacterized protein n=1 Tax=Parathielavia hyrcaniae TaxID=113614 RepID=A0AAN6PS11_9PEZI|nr:hypothetical protein N658DRAFT_501069 [Parathielavia hyrcaniae]
MNSTVGSLIDAFYNTPSWPADSRPCVSRKAWADGYRLLNPRHVTFHEGSKGSIDNFLGPGLDYVQRLPSEVDDIGLQYPAHSLNLTHQAILSEGDVTRDFDQNFEPFRLAFSGGPFLWPRSLCGPTGPTNTSVTVDYQLTWPGQNPLLERAAMIGELKQPFVIIPSEWTPSQRGWVDNPGDMTKRLQREMRGYAHRYKCPQVFVFDSVHLVILQFRAASKDQIQDQDCHVDICIIPREKLFQEQCTIQYALYRLAWRGWMRLSATSATQEGSKRKTVTVAVDGIPRAYEWWSGKPFWEVAPGRYQFGHPNGWKRQFFRLGTGGYWIWADDNGNYPDGGLVYDTGNCLE